MSTASPAPTNEEIIRILLDVKKYQPLKTNYQTSSDYIRILWFAQQKGLVKNTEIGTELSTKGQSFLDSGSDYEIWDKSHESPASTLTDLRNEEKAKALKDMRKYGLRLLFWGAIFYLVCHFWIKIF